MISDSIILAIGIVSAITTWSFIYSLVSIAQAVVIFGSAVGGG